MAKRTNSRSDGEDAAPGAPSPPKARRSRATPSMVAGAPPRDIESQSMASEPSEEDIRLRAYHRYLERGGGHGMDFNDWLEAERELRTRRG
jgi:Protein of unknown function (DUF2934)